MKTFVFALFIGLISTAGNAQTIIGSWQLIKETTCLESEVATDDDETEDLVADMKSRSGPDARVLRFGAKNEGDESIRILTRKKSAGKQSFLYKFDGTTLYILDKKSQVIADTYTVDSLTADALILSHAQRACETKVFARIK